MKKELSSALFILSGLFKYLFFLIFFAIMLLGFFTINVPSETPYEEMLKLVYRGMGLTFLGGIGSLVCLFRITR
ncbi:MAG: hypothetical protein WCP33_03560 [Deltaproteobacteria bacterium]